MHNYQAVEALRIGFRIPIMVKACTSIDQVVPGW